MFLPFVVADMCNSQQPQIFNANPGKGLRQPNCSAFLKQDILRDGLCKSSLRTYQPENIGQPMEAAT